MAGETDKLIVWCSSRGWENEQTKKYTFKEIASKKIRQSMRKEVRFCKSIMFTKQWDSFSVNPTVVEKVSLTDESDFGKCRDRMLFTRKVEIDEKLK